MANQLTTLKAVIADWANRQDWTDALVASYISMAEQKFNDELRIARMIEFDEGTITARCAILPEDWLSMDLVRVANQYGADGFYPVHYKARDEFFRESDHKTAMNYTIVGRTMFFGGTPQPIDGTVYKLAYYGEVPPLNDATDSWLYIKYPSLYLYGSLMHADLHAVGEEQNSANMKALCEDMINKLNNAHLLSKASGSRVDRGRGRSFG